MNVAVRNSRILTDFTPKVFKGCTKKKIGQINVHEGLQRGGNVLAHETFQLENELLDQLGTSCRRRLLDCLGYRRVLRLLLRLGGCELLGSLALLFHGGQSQLGSLFGSLLLLLLHLKRKQISKENPDASGKLNFFRRPRTGETPFSGPSSRTGWP